MIGEQINIQQNNPIPPHTAETKIFGEAIKIGNTSSYADKSTYQLVAQSVVESILLGKTTNITSGNWEAGVSGNINFNVGNITNITSEYNNNITSNSGSNIIQTTDQGDNALKISSVSSSPGKNILDAGIDSNNILRNNSVDNFKTQNGLNTSDETVFFSDTNGVHSVGTSMTDGDGVRWKKGNAQSGDPITLAGAVGTHAAPNNPSDEKHRTMADYFLQESITDTQFRWKRVAGVGTWDTEPPLDGNGSGVESTQPDTMESYFSYVKTGHLINGWYAGKLNTKIGWLVGPNQTGLNQTHFSLSTGGDHLSLDLNSNYKFPYTHGGELGSAQNPNYSGAVVFDVIITCGFELQFASFVTDGLGNNEDFYGFKGIIYQGSNTVWFYKYMRRETGNTDDRPWLIPLSNNDLVALNSSGLQQTQSVNFNFNFQMWANTKAYDRVSYGTQAQQGVIGGGLGGGSNSPEGSGGGGTTPGETPTGGK
jgi:hypothetical protein